MRAKPSSVACMLWQKELQSEKWDEMTSVGGQYWLVAARDNEGWWIGGRHDGWMVVGGLGVVALRCEEPESWDRQTTWDT